jgi:hypothetical protein
MKKGFVFLLALVALSVAVSAQTHVPTMVEGGTGTFTVDNTDYEVNVLVISDGQVKFKINGEITDALKKEDSYTLADGRRIYIAGFSTHNTLELVTFGFDRVIDDVDGNPVGVTMCNKISSPDLRDVCNKDHKKLEANLGFGSPVNAMGIVNFNPRTFSHAAKEYELEMTKYGPEEAEISVNGQLCTLKPSYVCELSNGAKLEMLSLGYKKAFVRIWGQRTLYDSPDELSTDMRYYPRFFTFAKTVVGDRAPGSDVVAATDIMQSLGTRSKVGAARLASEITGLGELVSVGNPCNNPITAKIMGIDACHMGLEPGHAFIGLYVTEGYHQVIVAGYSDFETRLAARALAEWDGREGRYFDVWGNSLSNYHIKELKFPPESVEEPELPEEKQPVESDTELAPPSFPDEESVALKLHRGWNLVSLPGKLISFLDNDCAKKPVAFVYIKEENRYVGLHEAQKILKERFGEYLARTAFWIYSYDDCYQNIRVADHKVEIQVEDGWNLIPNLALTFSVEEQYWWEVKSQDWTDEQVSAPNTGMLIKVAQ